MPVLALLCRVRGTVGVLTSLLGVLEPLVFATLGGEDRFEEGGVVVVFEVVVGLLGAGGAVLRRLCWVC